MLCILTTLMKTKIIGYICIAIGVLSYVGRILIFYYARKKFLSSEWEKIQVLYKKDEVYYKTILEEDKMIQITEWLIPSSNKSKIVVSVNRSRLLYLGRREVKNSPILSLGILSVIVPYFVSNFL